MSSSRDDLFGYARRWRVIAAALLATLVPSHRAAFAVVDSPRMATARGEFAEAGTYALTLSCDLADFVLQSAGRATDGTAAEGIAKIPDEELIQRTAKAERAFSEQLKIEFDARPAPPPTIRFPTLQELRADPPQTILIEGKTPPDALRFTVAFPLGIGPVDLTLTGADADRLRQHLEKGETSAPFFPKGQPEAPPLEPPRPPGTWRFWAYPILIGMLLTILGLRAFLSPAPNRK